MNNKINVRNLSDVEMIEAVSLEDRGIAESTYDAIKQGAAINPDKLAMRFLLNGDNYMPDNISFKAKMMHYAVKLLKGKNFARPIVDVTYKELIERINQAANLFHSLGVSSDDVISLLLPNFPETHYAIWGGEAAGVVNPINPMLEPDIIREILTAAETKVLMALGPVPGTDIWDKVESIIGTVPSLEYVIVLFGKGDPKRNILSFEDEIDKYNSNGLDSGRRIKKDDVASMFHTGGTTGIPKLAVRTHYNELSNAMMLNLVWPMEREDVGLVGLPLFHVNAAIGTGLMPFSQGMTILLAGPAGYRTPNIVKNFFKIIEANRISCFSAVPTLYSTLLQQPKPEEDLGCVKFAVSGAAPMPVEVFNEFQKKTGIKLLEGYGLTEATLLSSITPLVDDPRIGSIGLRIPYTEMKTVILDQDGAYERDCKINEVGIIVNRGPHVSLGYKLKEHNNGLWTDDDKGKRWLNTGDLGRMDEDGYFWLTGRAKELIIRGGHNIDPKMIEETLHKHPAVSMAAAIGRPDSYAGELPVAYVTAQSGMKITEEELLDFAKENIPERAAIPKSIIIIDELPATAVGKIFKPQMVWWEIEKVFSDKLESFSEQLDSFSVNVDKHDKFGCLARVEFKVAEGLASEEVMENIKKELGKYSVNFEISRI